MADNQNPCPLYLHFGVNSPYWRLTADSDALLLSAIRNETDIAVPLTPRQAARVRSLTGMTASLAMSVSLFGTELQLHLVGRKVNAQEWAGTASPHTDTEAVARNLVEGLSFAESVVSEANSVIVIVDENGLIQRFNRLAEEYTGRREQDIIGESVFGLFMDHNEAAQSQRNIAAFFRDGHSYEVERLINTVKGQRLFLFRNKFVSSGSGKKRNFLICSGTDITDERQAREHLRFLATTDVLTGLPNRHAISERIKAAVEPGAQPEHALGILFLDLDNFKRINDHYGHLFGDRLLCSVSEAISECLASGQLLGRFGGDEFIVLQEGATVAELEATAHRILERMRAPFRQGLIEIYTNCSIGIAMYPEHGKDLESLMRSVDVAMYAAKEMGKRTYRVFAPQMKQRVADYVWLDTNLRKAIDEDLLELYYQPKFTAKAGTLCGVEALIRWPTPEHGFIAPSEFIPYAEESGLIGPLGLWVAKQAAAQAAAWRRQGINLRVAINVSARQLADKTSVDAFLGTLQAIDAPEFPLDIELTESCLIEDEAAVVQLLHQFRALGAKIHMDDFGTGYSSLSQLTRIPLDAIKLDAQFVHDIDKLPTSQAIARAIVAVARSLHLMVIAEGIESQDEERFLKRIGIDQMQGYLHARPMSAAALEIWLQQRRNLPLNA